MKLHKDKDLFLTLIAKAAENKKTDPMVVIKDYFLVLALKKIFEHSNQIALIGGTSLSKCFNLIQRFSEDIDLVGLGNSRKSKQKHTFDLISHLELEWEGTVESNNRKNDDFKVAFLNHAFDLEGELDPRIKLELITFTEPFPLVKVSIHSILKEELTDDEIIKYEMNDVTVLTQEPHRTFLEKIILEKELNKERNLDLISSETHIDRARDFYDIHKIWVYYSKRFPINNHEIMEIIKSRKSQRRTRTSIDVDEVSQYKLIDIFNSQNIAEILSVVDVKKLSIRDLDINAIESSLIEIDQAFDEISNKKVTT